MWMIRFSLFTMLGALVACFAYFLRDRRTYARILESRIANLIAVIAYNLLCYLIVVLPPAGDGIAPAAFLRSTSLRHCFPVIGSVLIISGIALAAITVRNRKALGGQDVKAGLLTTGPYRYFRHPIYTGIVWVALGLPLVTRNIDGLLMFPLVLGVNIVQAGIEERYEVGVRFGEQYEAYKRTTRMFGPVWLWSTLAVLLLVLVGVAATAE
jgi:protein-S-isoprenylcysteine O-methyltransferase Ste14